MLENSAETKDADIIKLDSNVSLEQVIGLVDIIGESANGSVDAGRLAGELGVGVDLLPILNVAEKLGLVHAELENVSITEFGRNLHGGLNYKGKARLLKEKLVATEPCKTALKLVSKQGSASVRQITNILRKMDVWWNQNSEANESAVRIILTDWALEAELLKRNKRGFFEGLSGGESETSRGNATESKAAATREFRKSVSAARKKLRESRRAAWKAYRDELAAARRTRNEAVALAKDKN